VDRHPDAGAQLLDRAARGDAGGAHLEPRDERVAARLAHGLLEAQAALLGHALERRAGLFPDRHALARLLEEQAAGARGEVAPEVDEHGLGEVADVVGPRRRVVEPPSAR
jgi:hypothetical protein